MNVHNILNDDQIWMLIIVLGIVEKHLKSIK